VPPQDFLDYCYDAYCTSLQAAGEVEAQRAACNVISTYHTTCFLETGQAINWRSKTLCPKTCKSPFEFNGLITNNCPLTCGLPLYAYTRDICRTTPYSGCICPTGMARLNDTCVAPNQCQCTGDNGQYYNHGETVISGDKCEQCKCGDFGLWSCQPSLQSCTSVCTVLAGQHVTTFDSRHFVVDGDCPKLKIVQSNDPTIDVSVTLELLAPSFLAEDGESLISPSKVTVTYQGNTASVTMKESGVTVDNGFTPNVYARQIGQDVYALDFQNGLIHVKLFRNGLFFLRMKSVFKSKVIGICGNMDDNKNNDLISPSNSLMDPKEFLRFYSECSDPTFKELTQTPMNSICQQISDVPLSPNSRVDSDSFITLCNNVDEKLRCMVLELFGLLAHIDYTTSFQNTSCGAMLCQRREYDICDINCRDGNSVKCEKERMFGCTCGEGQYYKHDETCAPRSKCGCYDMEFSSDVIEPGAVYERRCHECVCTETSEIKCSEFCEEIICANSQVARSTLLEGQTNTTCLRKMCPKPYFTNEECINVLTSKQLCYCSEGYKQTQTGQCVLKCPCYEGGQWYADGYEYIMNCQRRVCHDGIFEYETSDSLECTGTCVLTGSSMKVKSFDATTLSDYSISGSCNYWAVKSDLTCSVIVKAIQCGSKDTPCLYECTIKSPFIRDNIILKSADPGAVMVGDREFTNFVGPNITITNIGIYMAISCGDSMTILWNGALTVRIMASSKLMNKVSGLCGNFNGKTSDDKIGSDNLEKDSMSKLAKSWIVNPDLCTISDTESVADCQSNRLTWAEKTCSVILEGEAFYECRKRVSETRSYYDNCVMQACNCDTGGDCECLCDAIAAFAAHCNEVGAPGKWRHQRLCPIQCDGGSVYEACGNTCTETCGKSVNSSSCTSLTCVEGCFCPSGYLRSYDIKSQDITCVLKSECPCIDDRGRELFPGQSVTINCQECECMDGEIVCTGKVCEKCDITEFTCNNGQCIDGEFKCNGYLDCLDGEDEFNCTECNGFYCDNKECAPLNSSCDGKIDCSDGSDEVLCECNSYEVKCTQSNMCIFKDFVCDNKVDCLYGEDEHNCTICPTNFTHCNQTYCIDKNFMCDNHDDCGDGSDEIGCTTSVPPTTTLEECKKTKATLDNPAKGIYPNSETGIANDVFTSDGWSPGTGKKEILNLVLDSQSDAVLERIEFVVRNASGTTLELNVNTKESTNNFLTVIVSKDPFTYAQPFNDNFSVINIASQGIISNLKLDVCYTPIEVTTPVSKTTTTVAPTTSTTPKAKECEEGVRLSDAHLEYVKNITRDNITTEDGKDIIAVQLRPSSIVKTLNVTELLFRLNLIDSMNITIFKRNGSSVSEVVDTKNKTLAEMIVYNPVDGNDVHSILIEFYTQKLNLAGATFSGASGCVTEETTTLTTPSSWFTTPKECEEGTQLVVDNHLRPVTNITEETPKDGRDFLEFQLHTSLQVKTLNVSELMFHLSFIDSMNVTIIKRNGSVVSEVVDIKNKTYKDTIIYKPFDGNDINIINIVFYFDEPNRNLSRVSYVGAKGCGTVTNCSLGYCNGTCLDQYDNLCLSPCPSLDCCK
ncbi:zonadhesin, partial [Biomphalaria glabrata]